MQMDLGILSLNFRIMRSVVLNCKEVKNILLSSKVLIVNEKINECLHFKVLIYYFVIMVGFENAKDCFRNCWDWKIGEMIDKSCP